MAFRPPTFNLTCAIYRNNGVGGAYGFPDLTVSCNLSPGRRSMVWPDNVTGGSIPGNFASELLLPKRTDIRATYNAVASDAVEVPAGSKRFYQVMVVEDVGRGFLNEYRLALMRYEFSGNTALLGPLSAPVPLP